MAEERSEGGTDDRVLVQVCLECGKQYTFEDEEPPSDLTCEKCGNTVFRPFYDSAGPNEGEDDFEDSTGRDLATDAGGTDVSRTDLLDLNNP